MQLALIIPVRTARAAPASRLQGAPCQHRLGRGLDRLGRQGSGCGASPVPFLLFLGFLLYRGSLNGGLD